MSRRHFLMNILILLMAVLLAENTLPAQDFRVFTRIYDLAQKNQNRKAPVVVRSITLFHAGKSYDFLSSLGEVSIFDPAHNRFIILNTERDLATTVHIDQIKHHLKIAEKITREHMQKLEEQTQKKQIDARSAIANLKFQLAPDFEEIYSTKSQQLMMQGTGIRYSVRCDNSRSAELVNAYMNYADWIARLNYVLHPGLTSPNPRLQLNASLKKHKLIPIEVELKTSALHLRAEHQIRWELGKRDRTNIDSWEKQLKSKDIKVVSLHEYQKVMIASQSR